MLKKYLCTYVRAHARTHTLLRAYIYFIFTHKQIIYFTRVKINFFSLQLSFEQPQMAVYRTVSFLFFFCFVFVKLPRIGLEQWYPQESSVPMATLRVLCLSVAGGAGGVAGVLVLHCLTWVVACRLAHPWGGIPLRFDPNILR